jgi:hypothetical protein
LHEDPRNAVLSNEAISRISPSVGLCEPHLLTYIEDKISPRDAL